MKSKNLSNILKSSGFKNIELDNIIESKHILKRSGGNFRQYLFSFYDQRNVEWSLRPDLTLSSVIKFIRKKDQSKTKKRAVVIKKRSRRSSQMHPNDQIQFHAM